MITINDARLKHSLQVARKMRKIALEHNPHKESYANEMFTLGLVHDIGYEFSKNQGEHPKLGGELLRIQNYKYWKEVYFHGQPDCGYSSRELDILNTADLLTNKNGDETTVQERIQDISNRYGEDSVQTQKAYELAQSIGLV